MSIIETLTNMIVSVFYLQGEDEHVLHRVTFLMMDDTGIIVRQARHQYGSKIVFIPASNLLRIEQLD